MSPATATTRSTAEAPLTNFHYDALDRLVLVEYPEIDGVRLHQLIDLRSRSATDSQPPTATATPPTFVYDELNRVVAVVDPELAGPPAQQYSVSTTYDAVGNRVAETDRRGHRPRVGSTTGKTGRSRPTGTASCIALDSIRRSRQPRVSHRRQRQHHSHRSSTSATSRCGSNDPKLAITRLTRDAMGDIARELDGEGKETTRTFDLRRRLATETNGESETTTFGYDFVGNLTTIGAPWAPTGPGPGSTTRRTAASV